MRPCATSRWRCSPQAARRPQPSPSTPPLTATTPLPLPLLWAYLASSAAGGGFGSIMGRNAFQRPHAEAVQLLKDVMGIFAAA